VRKTLRTAVIGLGWAGTVHAAALERMPGIELVALADPDPARRAAFAGHRTVPGIPEVLALRPDYCVVATPTGAHEPVALQLAEAGVPALIEKPLAPGPAAARRIADAFARHGLTAGVGHTERHNAATAELARRLHAGEFGTVRQIITRRHAPYPPRVTDVGVARDLLVHDVDLVSWLGGASISAVTATVGRLTGGHEDTATATAHLRSGSLAHLHADWISPIKQRAVQVHTEAGLLTADAVNLTLTLHPTAPNGAALPLAASELQRLPVPERDLPFTVENRIMRDALLTGHVPEALVPLTAGVTAATVIDALLHAAATGHTTAVPHRPD
jgi:predicted dehydrogenase